MAESFNWICPHCERSVSIVPGTNLSTEIHYCPIVSASGPLALISAFTVCPNKECQQATLNVTLRAWDTLPKSTIPVLAETLKSWQLVPWGSAKALAQEVPPSIRGYYEEAGAVLALSPRAAAALARAALRELIRNYWGIARGTLADEISDLEIRSANGLTADTWQRLDELRQLAILRPDRDGGHLEEVEPGEAEQLLKLVTDLLAQTYMSGREREPRSAAS